MDTQDNQVGQKELLKKFIGNTDVGPAKHFGGLTCFALLSQDTDAPKYDTLSQALKAGKVLISEISDSASVPSLNFENRGKRPVLVLDGEELVGAKQNRVTNVSFIAPAGQTITIPVSCVEQGRWNYVSRNFKDTSQMQFSEGRRSKMESVSNNMKYGNSRQSDQGKVWSDIENKMRRMNVRSSTSSMSDVFEQEKSSVKDYVRAFAHLPNQVGMVFSTAGSITGLEAFGHSETCDKALEKIVRSIAIDALELNRGPVNIPDRDDVKEFLNKLNQTPTSEYEAVGEGREIRFDGSSVVGSCLLDKSDLVHLVAFNQDKSSTYKGSGYKPRNYY